MAASAIFVFFADKAQNFRKTALLSRFAGYFLHFGNVPNRRISAIANYREINFAVQIADVIFGHGKENAL